ncbi:Acetyltransferase [Frankia canadensis]|uniref:Acetyltransferase n=1 Tax=Frankia canadensis TaxID=1836972 RepID=A0A2I2KKA4_9ACTN|nr:GNAT family N-acetyltransferase [Frankia canadensis]SNQ46101.1 Acetyltransferase [Frankia canadensis]SOU53391.1 Acetyltransferase [Frankia canadensis]
MVTIRSAVPADAAGVQAVYAPFVAASAATFDEELPSIEALRAQMTAAPRRPWLVAEAGDGMVVGYAYASAHGTRSSYRWSANTSIYLTSGQHRRGLGRRLYGVLIAEMRRLGYLNLYAGITLPNDASVGLHTSIGFAPVGVYPAVGYRLGAWRDVGWFGLALTGPPPDPPAEPLAWHPEDLLAPRPTGAGPS